jgi:hypothetical protein
MTVDVMESVSEAGEDAEVHVFATDEELDRIVEEAVAKICA